MAQTFEVKVENGYVKLYKPDGALHKTICANANSAVVKGDEVHVSSKEGTIKVFSVKGFFKKVL